MALGGYTLANNVRSTLPSGASNSATTLTVAGVSAPFNPFPVPTAGFPGVATITDSLTAPTKIEIVTYTGRSANGADWDLTTVTRGAMGTTAQTWSTGAIIMQAPVADMLTGLLLLSLLEQGGACTLVGRSANSTGVLAFIQATSNDAVLRRRSNALGFGSVINADIDAAAAIALSKLESIAAQTIVGRGASSGAPSTLSASDMQVLAKATGTNLAFQTLTGQFIRQAPLETASTAITLDDATHHGRTIVCTSASAITITCPNTVSAFFQCSVIQSGAGRVTFSPSGTGAAVNNYHGHTKTLGQYTQVLLGVYSTSGGNKFLLQGETGA